MLQIPCTIQTFDEVFPDEDACRAFWDQQRWQLDFVCPRCLGLRGWLLATRGVMQCARKECGYQASSTAGTLFHKTKLPMRTWMRALVFCAEYPLLTVRKLAALLANVSLKTAGLMLRKIREASRHHKEEYPSITVAEPDPQPMQYQQEAEEAALDPKKYVKLLHQLVQRRKQTIAGQFMQYLLACVCAPPLRILLGLHLEDEPATPASQQDWYGGFT